MGVKMEVKVEVMRYAQDDSLVCRKHLSTSKSEFTSMSEILEQREQKSLLILPSRDKIRQCQAN